MNRKLNYCVIIIPGLGDNKYLLNLITKNWKNKYGIKPYIHAIPWKQTKKSFREKLQGLLSLIDQLSKRYEFVSIIGVSAGGSAAINAFSKREDKIHKVVNLVGRLKKGVGVYPSLESAGKDSPSFIESVNKVEKILANNSIKNRRKILTIRPKFGDIVVPTSTVSVQDGQNIRVPIIGHIPTIYLALKFPKSIVRFMK